MRTQLQARSDKARECTGMGRPQMAALRRAHTRANGSQHPVDYEEITFRNRSARGERSLLGIPDPAIRSPSADDPGATRLPAIPSSRDPELLSLPREWADAVVHEQTGSLEGPGGDPETRDYFAGPESAPIDAWLVRCPSTVSRALRAETPAR